MTAPGSYLYGGYYGLGGYGSFAPKPKPAPAKAEDEADKVEAD